MSANSNSGHFMLVFSSILNIYNFQKKKREQKKTKWFLFYTPSFMHRLLYNNNMYRRPTTLYKFILCMRTRLNYEIGMVIYLCYFYIKKRHICI